MKIDQNSINTICYIVDLICIVCAFVLGICTIWGVVANPIVTVRLWYTIGLIFLTAYMVGSITRTFYNSRTKTPVAKDANDTPKE